LEKVFGVAEDVDARVILVGDRRQHRSVTAGEPLKLLEKKAGLFVAEVTEILRQQGDYKKAAQALSEGRTDDAFAELDKLGWIKEVADQDRYQQLASAYLSAVTEKKKGDEHKSALVVSPTHAEGERITVAIRDGLKAEGKLGDEHIVTAWVPAHLTGAQKSDPTEYSPGDLVQFQQNAKGFNKGSRLVVSESATPPTELANRFEVYRPTLLSLAVGDRLRVTAGGKTKDGKHRLSNGSLMNIQGFTKQGDIIVDHGWVIDRDFGHITHGYVVTSYASQGTTVDKVFVGLSSESLPATDQRTAYVTLTRGKEEAQIFTDDRSGLLRAMSRPDNPTSATELSESSQRNPALPVRIMKRLGFSRGFSIFDGQQNSSRSEFGNESMNDRGMDHGG
jgi:ATP-dependent exoDNAse (exonuclease V) alpha subunit